MIKEIPKSQWPTYRPDHIAKMFVTEKFGIQEYHENGQIRLTIHHLKRDGKGWKDGITWDELQHCKRLVGYADKCAVEIYPPDNCLVNIANMRHLWIVDPPAFMWQKKKEKK